MKSDEKRFLGWNVLKMRGTLEKFDRDLKVEQREHFFFPPPNDSVKVRSASLQIRSYVAICRYKDEDGNRFERPKYVGRILTDGMNNVMNNCAFQRNLCILRYNIHVWLLQQSARQMCRASRKL